MDPTREKYEPSPRYQHISCRVGSKVVLHGGRAMDVSKDGRHSSVVEIFDQYTESWEQILTQGDAPTPGIYGHATVSLEDDLFSFGGSNGRIYFNTVHKLQTKSWIWSKLVQRNPDAAPMPKFGCGMISFDGCLGVLGGYGVPSREPTEPRSFIKNRRFTDGRGWTNEFHIYDPSEGVWTCPTTSGEKPSPRSGFTLTTASDQLAIMFGGVNGAQGCMADVHILTLSTMTWSKIRKHKDVCWPEERSGHAACCLNYGQQFPQLLITGGLDKYGKPLKGVWILDIKSETWREVGVDMKERWCHSLTLFDTVPGMCVFLEFGGSSMAVTRYITDDTIPKIADTTLLELKNVGSDECCQWDVTSVTDYSECGCLYRLREKMMRYNEALESATEHAKTVIKQLDMENYRVNKEKMEMEARVRGLERDNERMREVEDENDRLKESVEALRREVDMTRKRVMEVEKERDIWRNGAAVLGKEKNILIGRMLEIVDEKNLLKETATELEAEKEGLSTRIMELQEEASRAREVSLEGERDKKRLTEALRQSQSRVCELQRMVDDFKDKEQVRTNIQEQVILAERRGPSWEVMGDELEETEEILGIGGWAVVKVAKLRVAAKCLHSQLVYDYHRQLFRREMDVAARISHPNCLRFLGARLEGGMAIVTEYMPTSLRALINRCPRDHTPMEYIFFIALDVALALNYLHNMTPDPIIHRDLSSANVLLQPSPNGGWLAKVSDYGTANFLSQLQTENPGSPVYTAPESHDPALQTPKMDIYSFGVLLVEMWTCEFPIPERRAELMAGISNAEFLNLIQQCLNTNIDKRPTAAQLVNALQAM